MPLDIPGAGAYACVRWTWQKSDNCTCKTESGFKGQRIYVFPSLGLVVALTASLPGAEERLVEKLIVDAIADLADKSSNRNDSTDLEEIRALQERGFNGQTRIFQEEQDSPSRFSKEDVVPGIENFPATMNKLFSGENFGKPVLKVADE